MLDGPAGEHPAQEVGEARPGWGGPASAVELHQPLGDGQFKEVWLLFDNDEGRFPIYPGDAVWIEYAYTVSDTKWGRWFQRADRLPTEHLEVELAFPAALDPVVWGTETSMTAEASPLRSAPSRRENNGIRVFTWTTTQPALHAPSRLEWRFRARGPEQHATFREFR